MPRMVNGIGTRFYGQCDFGGDGSHQTTEWFVVMYVPILPRETVRIRKLGGNRFLELGDLPLSGSQVLRTYGFAVGYVAWLFAILEFTLHSRTVDWFFNSDAPLIQLLFWIGMGLAIAAPFILVKWSRYRALREARRSSRGRRTVISEPKARSTGR